jgi:hypothetical protein
MIAATNPSGNALKSIHRLCQGVNECVESPGNQGRQGRVPEARGGAGDAVRARHCSRTCAERRTLPRARGPLRGGQRGTTCRNLGDAWTDVGLTSALRAWEHRSLRKQLLLDPFGDLAICRFGDNRCIQYIQLFR